MRHVTDQLIHIVGLYTPLKLYVENIVKFNLQNCFLNPMNVNEQYERVTTPFKIYKVIEINCHIRLKQGINYVRRHKT